MSPSLLRDTAANWDALSLISSKVPMPWGSQTMAEIIAYPYWNRIYHQGQINDIASVLGYLE